MDWGPLLPRKPVDQSPPPLIHSHRISFELSHQTQLEQGDRGLGG